MTDQATTTAPAVEKESIGQKVEKLQARKTLATTEMNAAPEGSDKTGLQQEIAVIDRKLRWYAGRASEGKAVSKTTRPSTKAEGRKRGKSTAPATAAPAAPVTAANES